MLGERLSAVLIVVSPLIDVETPRPPFDRICR